MRAQVDTLEATAIRLPAGGRETPLPTANTTYPIGAELETMMQTPRIPKTNRGRHGKPRAVPATATGLAAVALPASLLLLPGPAAAQHAEHDGEGTTAAAGAPSADLPTSLELPVGRDSLLRVDARPGEGTVEVVLGPVELTPRLNHFRVPVQMMEWPVDGWLHGYSWQMRTADGDTLPASMLHHLGFIDPDRRQLFSPIAQRLVSAGNETKSPMLPRMIGVPMTDSTRLLVIGMFANPTDRHVEEAYLHVTIRVSPTEGSVLPRMSVRPFYLDVMGPVGAKSFPVPPGRTVKSWEGSPVVDGRILGLGGHAHDFARELRLVDVTTGDTIWRVAPETAGEHRLVSVPTDHAWKAGGVKIHAAHRYRAEVVYDNPTDGPAPHGGMGVIAGVVWTGDDRWPDLDRSNAAYEADLWNTLTAPERSGASDAHAHDGAARGEVQDTLEWRRRVEDGADGEEAGVTSTLEERDP